MVNVRELRVGNTVAGALGQTYTVTPELIQIVSVNPDWVDPIPLSPEILEKAGFHNESDLGTDYFKIKKKLCKSGWSERFTYYLPYKNLSTYTGDVTIKYLHQLQNLYHALTGEELEIKSPL